RPRTRPPYRRFQPPGIASPVREICNPYLREVDAVRDPRATVLLPGYVTLVTSRWHRNSAKMPTFISGKWRNSDVPPNPSGLREMDFFAESKSLSEFSGSRFRHSGGGLFIYCRVQLSLRTSHHLC